MKAFNNGLISLWVQKKGGWLTSFVNFDWKYIVAVTSKWNYLPSIFFFLDLINHQQIQIKTAEFLD